MGISSPLLPGESFEQWATKWAPFLGDGEERERDLRLRVGIGSERVENWRWSLGIEGVDRREERECESAVAVDRRRFPASEEEQRRWR